MFMVCVQFASAQQIVATDVVTIKTLNKSNNQTFLGRTHLHLNELQIYDLDSLWGVNIGTENGGIKCFSFSPDDVMVALGTYHGFIEVWEIKSRTRLWSRKAHQDQVNDIKFTPDGNSLISSDTEGRILISSVKGVIPKSKMRAKSNINAIELVPGRDQLFVTGDHHGTITVWNRVDGTVIKKWRAHGSYIFDLVFDESGKVLFSSSHDNLIKMWDFGSSKLKRTFRGHTKSAYTVDLSDDGKLLASGGLDNMVMLWEVSSGRLLTKYEGHADYVMVVRFVDPSTILSGSRDMTLRRWTITNKNHN